jgi:hypothetical protein
MSTQSVTDEFDDLDSFPEAWMAAAGDRLIGTVTGLGSRISDYNQLPYPIVTVRVDDSGRSTEGGSPISAETEKAFHAFRTVAKREVAGQRPRIGERIGIWYGGKAEKGDWHAYRVKVAGRKAAATPDWDAMQQDVEAELGDEPQEPPHEDDDGIPF